MYALVATLSVLASIFMFFFSLANVWIAKDAANSSRQLICIPCLLSDHRLGSVPDLSILLPSPGEMHLTRLLNWILYFLSVECNELNGK